MEKGATVESTIKFELFLMPGRGTLLWLLNVPLVPLVQEPPGWEMTNVLLLDINQNGTNYQFVFNY